MAHLLSFHQDQTVLALPMLALPGQIPWTMLALLEFTETLGHYHPDRAFRFVGQDGRCDLRASSPVILPNTLPSFLRAFARCPLAIPARQEMDNFKPRHVRLESLTYVLATKRSIPSSLRLCAFARGLICKGPRLGDSVRRPLALLDCQEMDAVKPRHVRLESLTYVVPRQSFYQTLYPIFFAPLRLCARPYLRGAPPR